MTRTSRWAAIIGVVCGAELIAVAVIGGAGIAAFISLEAALVGALIGFAAIATVVRQRQSASIDLPERSSSSVSPP